MAEVRILSTKKLLPNQRQYLLSAGFSVIEADFIGILFKPFTIDNATDNLIFTSLNGFKAFWEHTAGKLLVGNPVFCVGQKTKEVIERHGFRVEAMANDAKSLAEIIEKQYSGRRFAFFSGNKRRDELPETLTKAGVAFTETKVYDTLPAPQKMNAKFDSLLFFSPSAVESYLIENMITNETCFCIGETTAAALKGITENIVVAHKPSIENVIVQVRNYYKNNT
jgi:uroporphyrinogen-III synthase